MLILGMLIMCILHIPIESKHFYEKSSLWLYCVLWLIVKLLGEDKNGNKKV